MGNDLREELLRRRKMLLDYSIDKIHTNDIHGAQDALMDLREIDAKLEILPVNDSGVSVAKYNPAI